MDKTTKLNIVFIISVFILTWIIWSLAMLIKDTNTSLIITIGTFVPSCVGLGTFYITSKPKFRSLLKSSANFKMKLTDYLYIFLTIPVVLLISYLMMVILNQEVPNISYKFIEFPIVFIVILITMGPLGEEYGWRGLLLPNFLRKHSVMESSLIIGFIWSLWHLPLFFIEGALQSSFVELYGFIIAFLGYIFYTVIISLLITVIYKKTNGNLLSSILIHTVANMSIGVMPLVFNQIGAIIYLTVLLIVISLIYVLSKKNNFKESK